jgi:hypothetical protein
MATSRRKDMHIFHKFMILWQIMCI